MQKSGILELMDDLGKNPDPGIKKIMLGGGNPAQIPEINQLWRRRITEILATDGELEAMLAQYDAPQGKGSFLTGFARMLQQELGWNVSERNIAVTNGSQNGFFLIFNILSGDFGHGKHKKVLFPLAPEYIGYADQAIGLEHFQSHHPRIVVEDEPYFKYYVDFSDLKITPHVAALCASRPTNPTGNVLTDDEVVHLAALAQKHQIPLLLDNAYGAPFPHILFEDIKPYWDENTILSMSLSKLGLPAVRTGIIVAPEKVIEALSAANAILNLANSGIGQMITLPLLKDRILLDLSKNVIRSFYLEKRDRAVQLVQEIFSHQFSFKIHRPQGALFLWLWFPELKITTKELYQRLKKRGVIVVPGEYFFFGMDESADHWPHREQCIRVHYAREETELVEGLKIIAEEVGRG